MALKTLRSGGGSGSRRRFTFCTSGWCWLRRERMAWIASFTPSLLVRYEKLERSFMALNHIAAAIIAFRMVRLTINTVYR